MKIVFMGTPDFAVATLAALHTSEHEVAAVITAPDRPAGRGLKVQQSDVKVFALEKEMPLMQPEKLKNTEFLNDLQAINADLFIVVAFRMLPEVVWNMPKYGTVNLHGSLLPAYRGAAPIHWAVINGEKETGVTVFSLKHEIDTGRILAQKAIEIGKNESTGELYHRMKDIGAALMIEVLKDFDNLWKNARPQEASEETRTAPKLFRQDGKIDWTQAAHKIHDKIRGLSPFPVAWTSWEKKSVKLFKSTFVLAKHELKTGSVIQEGKELRVATNDGFIQIVELQVEGKKRMKAADFNAGYQNQEISFG